MHALSSVAPVPTSSAIAHISDPSPQRLWHSTIDTMSAIPGADLPELTELRDWITNGIRLTFDSTPIQAEVDYTRRQFALVYTSTSLSKRSFPYRMTTHSRGVFSLCTSS